MPIQVICPGCHARFQVSDKFAGKKGPCPKCKAIIRVPELSEQVVIHGPEEAGGAPRDTAGGSVLRPIARKRSRVQPLVLVGVAGVSILVLVVALLMRGAERKDFLLAVGAMVMGPPLALAGYSFLRHDELEPYSGRQLVVRSLICGTVYALLWGAYSYFYFLFFGDAPAETWNVLPFAVILMSVGAGTAYACYDLDLGSGFFHYSLYLLVTILLRLTMGLSPV